MRRMNEEEHNDTLKRIADVQSVSEEEQQRIELINAMALIDDQCLEDVIDKLNALNIAASKGSDLKTITIPEKINLNKLGPGTTRIINSAMCKVSTVAKFIIEQDRAEMGFSDRCRNHFVGLYAKLRQEGYLYDDLFKEINAYFLRNLCDIGKVAAATIMLVHYFWKCDVFEKTEREKAAEKKK